MTGDLTSTRLEVPSDPDAFQDEMERRGWGDGLPLVPPTPERVAAFVRASGRPAAEVVATLPPAWAEATVEKAAVNAVMAGCRPEHVPIVLAAIRAAAREPFNLHTVLTSTGGAALCAVVSGPIAAEIGMNARHNVLGPGNRANATIGRAVRLVLMNVGGARPGTLDRATQGSPAKYTYCVAENEAASPWEPLRTSLGFGAGDSVVTVIAGEGPHNINDHGSTTADSLLRQITGTLATPGSNNAYMQGDSYLFLGPEHARQLAAEGLDREAVQRLVFEGARIPRGRFGPGQLARIEDVLGADQRDMTREALWVGGGPEDVRVLVVGGDGRHSCWVPTFGMTRSCSEVIRKTST